MYLSTPMETIMKTEQVKEMAWKMDLNGFMYLKSNEYVQVKIDNTLISSITLDQLI